MKNKKVKLGDYIEEYSVKNKQGQAYPVYSVTNSNGFCTEYFNKDVSSKDKRNYKIVPYGCFAYNPSRINVGSIDWQHYEKNVIVSPLYIVFKCSNKIKQKYLQYFFESEYGKHLINSKVSGSVRANLKFSSMCDFELNIGTIEEQQKIISTIDKINKLINAQKQQLEKLDELVKSKFNEMFGDPIDNPKKWEIKTIDYICSSIVRGPFGSSLKKEFFVAKGQHTYKVYEQKNAINQNAKIGNYYIDEKRYNILKRFTVNPNDIIMSCSGTIGKFFRIPIDSEKGIINQALLKYTLNEKINYQYFLFMMDKIIITVEKKGSGIKNIGSVKFIKNIKFSLPPIELQNKFAEFVKKVDNLKMNIQKQIDLYTELLNKKMDEYFN